MPTEYFYASGWTPRGQNEELSRQAMIQWLQSQARSGEFTRRTPMHPSPWNWSFTQDPRQTIIGLPAGGRRLLSIEQRLWNFIQIPAGASRHTHRAFTTKGYVTRRSVMEFGGSSGPRVRPPAARAPEFQYYDALRCLPETDDEALEWGYTRTNATAWRVILDECRRYNATIRSRLSSGYSAGRAHASAVRDMQAQSHDLILQSAFEIALSVGSSNAMNVAPIISDYAGRSGASVTDFMPVRDF